MEISRCFLYPVNSYKYFLATFKRYYLIPILSASGISILPVQKGHCPLSLRCLSQKGLPHITQLRMQGPPHTLHNPTHLIPVSPVSLYVHNRILQPTCTVEATMEHPSIHLSFLSCKKGCCGRLGMIRGHLSIIVAGNAPVGGDHHEP